MTLTEFLLARIAEDEELLTYGSGKPLRIHVDPGGNGDSSFPFAERWRAVCEAHRRIVEKCQYAASPEFESDYDLAPRYDLADDTLRALAAIYADRDGWREEWR